MLGCRLAQHFQRKLADLGEVASRPCYFPSLVMPLESVADLDDHLLTPFFFESPVYCEHVELNSTSRVNVMPSNF